ncbi:four helix bundle protein [Ancylomarina salipaludis]|uniref:Four helix bundle protein n=1 Tax=Ancylomarina salipaludis TaxID=2501299 RepID=A0A4Q1JKN7_9BACT|nr:four helix bundle protein [Ancylomarina salipaludis]RXQ91468.1 four helix bundle protein [Ancylomarina salipaludis]
MAKVEKFEDLKVWQESRLLVRLVYEFLNTNKDYGFKDQIQRASISIMNNIAEGFERNSDTEFKRFLDIAKASCGEVRSMLYLAEDLKYITVIEAENLRNRCCFLSGSISNLMKYLRK